MRLVPSSPGPLRGLTRALLGIVLVLVGTGVLMVESASQVVSVAAGLSPLTGLIRQSIHAAVGVILLVVLSRVPTRFFRRYAWWALGAGLLLQLLVYTPLGQESQGNRNWIVIGSFSAQPGEVMKVVLLVWVATVLVAKQHLLHRWRHAVLPVLPVVALSLSINVLGGDLGTVMIIVAVVFGCLFFAPVRLRILGGIALVAAAGIGVMTAIKPNRVIRVAQFFEYDCLHRLDQYHGACWQSIHSFWALARGGVLGAGFENSLAKWSWLPEAETDFIFAIIGEEFGLIGAVALLLLFLALLVVLSALLGHCRAPFSRTVIGGVIVWIAAQMIVNVSVVLGVFPVLGVPLPLVSAGGTSLITTLMAVGVVLSCVREEAATPRPSAPADATAPTVAIAAP